MQLGDLRGLARGRLRAVAASDKADEPEGVLVGMSGGVDSAVAALAAQGAGLRVVGVTLTLWTDPGVRRRAQLLLARDRPRGRAEWRTAWASLI